MEPSRFGSIQNNFFFEELTFVQKFNVLSQGINDEFMSPEIKNLLMDLEAAGCVLNESKREIWFFLA